MLKIGRNAPLKAQWRAEGGGREWADLPRHPRQEGIQRGKLQKFKYCNWINFPIVRLIGPTHATWI